ncbi:MAG: hypothetical protein Q8K75_07125 [Chlamydiales bacterium]|nr:hypothetical protein [Chlamydiales bacterium]
MNIEIKSVARYFLSVPKQLVPATVVLGVSAAADLAHKVLPPVADTVGGLLGSYVGNTASFVTKSITWIPAVASRGALTFVYSYAAKAIGGAVIFRLGSAGEFMKTSRYTDAFQTAKDDLKERILKLKGCRNVLLGTAVAYQALSSLGLTADFLMPLFIPAEAQTLANWALVLGSGCGLAAAWMGSISRTPRVIPANSSNIASVYSDAVKCALVNGSLSQTKVNERTFADETKTMEEKTLDRLQTQMDQVSERARKLTPQKKESNREFDRRSGKVIRLTQEVVGNADLQPKLVKAQAKLDLATADKDAVTAELDDLHVQIGQLQIQITAAEGPAAQAILRKQQQHQKTVGNTRDQVSRLAAMYLVEGGASDFAKHTLLKVSKGTRQATIKDASWVAEQEDFASQDLENASTWLKKASPKQKYRLEKQLLKLDLANLPEPKANEKEEASVLRWLGHASAAMASSKFVDGQINAALVRQYMPPKEPTTNQRFWNTLQV